MGCAGGAVLGGGIRLGGGWGGAAAGVPVDGVLQELGIGRQVELALQALPMGLHRLHGQPQRFGGFPGRQAPPDQAENLQLAVAEPINGIRSRAGPPIAAIDAAQTAISGTQVTLSGTKTAVQGSGTLDLSSGGIASLKGSLTKIG